MSLELQIAFISLGLTFLLWGIDNSKSFEKTEFTKKLKKFLGHSYVIIGTAVIFISIFLLNSDSNETSTRTVFDNLLNDYPNANISINYKNNSENDACNLPIGKYYKISVLENKTEIITWLDIDFKILCSLRTSINYINNSFLAQEENLTDTIYKKNCMELGGHVCISEDQCTVPLMNSTDSYCCPIECGECLIDCDDKDSCTLDKCDLSTDFKCEYIKIC